MFLGLIRKSFQITDKFWKGGIQNSTLTSTGKNTVLQTNMRLFKILTHILNSYKFVDVTNTGK